jgi:hypothetical protein
MPTFEDLIKQTVKNKKPSKKYEVPKKSGDFKIAKEDVKSFKELFTKKPNAGVGNGEVSLFWLFGKGSGHEGGGKADLVLNGKNCEVKSYPKHDTMTLGKFKDDKAALELLSYLFSFINLFMEFGTSKTGSTAYKTLLSFKVDDVVMGLAYYDVLYDIFTSKKVQDKIAKLKSVGADSAESQRKIKSKKKEFQSFAKQLKTLRISNDVKTSTDADRKKLAAKIVGFFLTNKLKVKPGNGGYMVNCKKGEATNVHFHLVNVKTMKLSYANLKAGFNVSSGEIQITKANLIFN